MHCGRNKQGCVIDPYEFTTPPFFSSMARTSYQVFAPIGVLRLDDLQVFPSHPPFDLHPRTKPRQSWGVHAVNPRAPDQRVFEAIVDN